MAPSPSLLLTLLLMTTPLTTSHTTSPKTCTWTRHGSPYPLTSLSSGVCPPPTTSSPNPWSHPPHCPPPTNTAVGGDVPDDCVFTYSTFRNNQGVSLITTPELAASVASYLDDTAVPLKFQSHPSSPQAHPSIQNKKDDGYVVRSLPGRGKGVIAKRAYQKHEIVMVGYPTLLVRLDFLNGERFSQKAQGDMLREAVARLPESTRRDVLALAKSTGGEPIRDAIRTNAFGIEIEGVNHMALFVEGSRVNHGCRPNVFWRFSNRDMTMQVVALREIRPGDEIVHSYAPLGYTMMERQQMLKPWGFQCSCEMCTASQNTIQASDARRERLFEIHSTLSMAVKESTLAKERIDMIVREALALIEKEELDPQLVEYHQMFARAYMSVNEVKLARKHIKLADTKWTLYEGEEHSNIEGIKKLWQEVEELEEELAEDED
ncbi:hypothetical protein OQA88_9906 [Cercophora sp. LCS_1]